MWLAGRDEFLRTASAAVRSVAAECIRAMEEEGGDAPSASVLKCIYHTQVRSMQP